MRILLLGEYSNVHNTLAEGLRALGHEVCVASNGDFWKDYPRDIDLQREAGVKGTASFLWRLAKALPKMRGYDVVQLINPMFLELKAERLFSIYRYLKKHNKKVILGSFGMDYYWVKVNSDEKPLRYSDFNIGDNVRHDEAAEVERADWIGTAKQRLNEYIANDCDGIVAGLYEYWVTYRDFKHKMQFIPFPIKPANDSINQSSDNSSSDNSSSDNSSSNTDTSETMAETAASPTPLRIFVGISKNRHAYKGTDIMLAAAEKLRDNYPDRVTLKIANGVPFAEYQQMMDSSDCILDQLYSYTPAMNALLAMSKGIIVVGGGEPENYDILDPLYIKEHEAANIPLPILNVLPVCSATTNDIDFSLSVDSCYRSLEQLVLHPELIPLMKQQSIDYINRFHDYRKVAERWVQQQRLS